MIGMSNNESYKRNRVQLLNPRSKTWTKVDKKNGQILGHKKDGTPWKNIRKVPPGRTHKMNSDF